MYSRVNLLLCFIGGRGILVPPYLHAHSAASGKRQSIGSVRGGNHIYSRADGGDFELSVLFICMYMYVVTACPVTIQPFAKDGCGSSCRTADPAKPQSARQLLSHSDSRIVPPRHASDEAGFRGFDRASEVAI
jgi:hypothetical protein